MSRNINMGGLKLKIEATGVIEALEKVNLLLEKLEEAKTLISEIASMEINIKFREENEDTLIDL